MIRHQLADSSEGHEALREWSSRLPATLTTPTHKLFRREVERTAADRRKMPLSWGTGVKRTDTAGVRMSAAYRPGRIVDKLSTIRNIDDINLEED